MAAADVGEAGGARPRGDRQPRDGHPAAGPPQGEPGLSGAEEHMAARPGVPCVCWGRGNLWIIMTVPTDSGLSPKNAR